MAGALAKREIVVPNVPALAMAKGFTKYKPEEEKAVRKAEVEENETLRQLKAAWKAVEYARNQRRRIPDYSWQHCYEKASELAKQVDYSAEDVERFSIALAEFQGEEEFSEKAGLFLSALINNGKDSDYVIHTEHLGEGIHRIGWMNTKNIIVKGDVSESGRDMADGELIVRGNARNGLGVRMEGGRITVKGDSCGLAGYGMQGGAIIVEGNAADSVGLRMEGGTITVKGNAGKEIGQLMNGGEIHIEGKFKDVGNVIHGKIFHKGVKIIDR
ncbi:MAG: hypothetical protein PHF60_03090 [Candidatus ainarchaeum sp.]|nr:hypothetical protein [Candidatus ainarchaeum sp.]